MEKMTKIAKPVKGRIERHRKWRCRSIDKISKNFWVFNTFLGLKNDPESLRS